MNGHLLVSISSIFDDTRKQASRLLSILDREEIPVSLLIAPHIDGNWHLAKDKDTKSWLRDQADAGRVLILNGFDRSVQGRRAEFANLDSHEAKLRLAGATRQMAKIGFEPTIFAPPRWRMSPVVNTPLSLPRSGRPSTSLTAPMQEKPGARCQNSCVPAGPSWPI